MKKHIKTSHGIALLTVCLFLALALITYNTKQLEFDGMDDYVQMGSQEITQLYNLGR